MAVSWPRWPSIALVAAVLAAATLGFLGWRKSHRLAEEHASRAQRAMDEMGKHYHNIKFISSLLKTAKRPSDRARYEGMRKSSQRVLAKLEEAAARHERLARSYGYAGPFKRPDPDPELGRSPSRPPESRR